EIGQREIDHAVQPAERNAGLGAVGGQGHQALALSTGEDHREDLWGHGADVIHGTDRAPAERALGWSARPAKKSRQTWVSNLGQLCSCSPTRRSPRSARKPAASLASSQGAGWPQATHEPSSPPGLCASSRLRCSPIAAWTLGDRYTVTTAPGRGVDHGPHGTDPVGSRPRLSP